MKKLIILTIFVFFGLQGNLLSQSQKNPKRFYIENPTKKSVLLPFRFINNLIILSVKINNSDTLNFILDSGISTTIITDPYIVEKLNLQTIREINLSGFGGENKLTAKLCIENVIRLGGVLGQHQDILVIQNPDFDFSRHLGIKVHGMLGYNLFRDLIIEVNYDNKLIRFNTPKTYVYKLKRKSITLPIQISDTKPIIQAGIFQEDSATVTGDFLIDTGASLALWIDLYSNNSLVLPHRTQTLYLGAGLGGPVYGLVGRIKELNIGNLKLPYVIASYTDTSLIHERISNPERIGTIGADILSRFNLIFDYRNNKITLKPNSKFYEPFQINLTGMEICCPIPEEKAFRISNITYNSPADIAGLKVGDQIESIDYQSTTSLTFSEVQSLLLKKSGHKMIVQYFRDGNVTTTVLLFKNYL